MLPPLLTLITAASPLMLSATKCLGSISCPCASRQAELLFVCVFADAGTSATVLALAGV